MKKISSASILMMMVVLTPLGYALPSKVDHTKVYKRAQEKARITGKVKQPSNEQISPQTKSFETKEQETFAKQNKEARISQEVLEQKKVRADEQLARQNNQRVEYETYRRNLEEARFSRETLYSQNMARDLQNPRIVRAWDDQLPLTMEDLSMQDINRFQFRRNRPAEVPVEKAGGTQ